MQTSAPVTDAKYVSFTTFTKDGRPKSTPVWIANLGDGTAGFTTGSTSYKVKRLRRDPKCQLQPCDGKGKVLEGSAVTDATAVVTPDRFTEVRSAVRKKYGFSAWMMGSVAAVAGLFGNKMADTAVIITMNEAKEPKAKKATKK